MAQGEDKARGASQLGSLPLFLSLFLLLLAFFIFLNSISTRQTGKSEDVLDSVRSSFASVLRGGTGAGVFEGEPGKVDDKGLRDELLEAFDPLLSETTIARERSGNPFYVDFKSARLFEGDRVDPVFEFRDFSKRVSAVLASKTARDGAEFRFWFNVPAAGAKMLLARQRAARLAEIMIASGTSRANVSIGFRELPRPDTVRFAVHLGAERNGAP
ncbi:hypothetical protein [Nisaea nitritireducens]|uniref:hypothetical protein n=1 Tax=Nisaea nitritireducens TaxID=568392 RepID=UPI00186706B6|nr:hypothetical protein [Nisaea nitritireducens]